MKNKENYTGVKAISFLFPFIGLLIYAINVGKDDDKLAKNGAKWALYGIGAYLLLVLFLIEGLESILVVSFWAIIWIVIYKIVKKFIK